MGTRSLLGYEQPNGKVYAQYLQYDGGPENQGHNYFIGVLDGLVNINYKDDSGNPNPTMFNRIQHFLNETQYQSGHSVNNHLTCTRKEWFNQGIDCNQEWQYLFTQTGDFIYFSSDMTRQIVIPWELTKRLLENYHDLTGSSYSPKGLRDSPWWDATRFKDYDENKKVIKWGKDIALHLHDELGYESSKLLKDKMLRGGSVTIAEPLLLIEYGKINAFPDQGEDGFRNYSVAGIGTTLNPVIIKTTFADHKGKRKDKGSVKALYLHGKNLIKE